LVAVPQANSSSQRANVAGRKECVAGKEYRGHQPPACGVPSWYPFQSVAVPQANSSSQRAHVAGRKECVAGKEYRVHQLFVEVDRTAEKLFSSNASFSASYLSITVLLRISSAVCCSQVVCSELCSSSSDCILSSSVLITCVVCHGRSIHVIPHQTNRTVHVSGGQAIPSIGLRLVTPRCGHRALQNATNRV
jgi:hypothetical protein